MVQLKGKNAIVTGAALGIGRAYTKALAEAGVNVALCDLEAGIVDYAKELEGLGIKAIAFQGNVSDPELARRVVDGAKETFGSVDILVNNAGAIVPTMPDDDLEKTLQDWELIVDTNLKGEFLFGRAVITEMLAQGTGGEIVNVSTDHLATCGTPHDVCPNLPTCPWNIPDDNSFEGPPRPTGGGDAMDLYDASKWALSGLTFGWAKELRPHNIRVNALCMGATDSHMIRGFFGEAATPEVIATWMKAEDAAQVLIDLLSEGPSGRTGENMNFCIGRPCKLEPANPNRYIMEEDLRA